MILFSLIKWCICCLEWRWSEKFISLNLYFSINSTSGLQCHNVHTFLSTAQTVWHCIVSQATWSRCGGVSRWVVASGRTVVFIKGSIRGELSSRISRGLFKKSVIAYCLEKLAVRFIVICSLCWLGTMFLSFLWSHTNGCVLKNRPCSCDRYFVLFYF